MRSPDVRSTTGKVHERRHGRTVVPERPFDRQPLIEHLSDEHQCVERQRAERPSDEQMFDLGIERPYDGGMANKPLSRRQRQILEFIEAQTRDRGFPPSVREIGQAVGLTSPSTVHSHLNTLQRLGYLRRDPTKPRAIEVRWDPNSGVVMDRRPVRHVPLVGDVAAGTDVLAQENVEELFPVPTDFTGEGDLFMLRVRGDSMIEAGILDGDFVIAVQQPTAERGQIVVAGIPGDEATVKTYQPEGDRIVLSPANSSMEPMVFAADEVTIYGRVVTVMRRL
jgi:repressor LexA